MAAQNVTPWAVEAERVDDKMTIIDYDHLITQFGCQKFDQKNIDEFENILKYNNKSNIDNFYGDKSNIDIVEGIKNIVVDKNIPNDNIVVDNTSVDNKLVDNTFSSNTFGHHFIRRNLVFAHRDFDVVVDKIRKGEKFFLYTGRGPSSRSMHLGHSVPFMLCKYLQTVFRVPIVIQITDDEKYLCKSISLDQAIEYGDSNIKDIIAYGFDPELTYIFSNYHNSHLFYRNILGVSKHIIVNDVFKVFGFDMRSNIGMVEFPARQIAAAFSSSYSFLEPGMQCLIPCAVDQDPYFRLARDISNKITTTIENSEKSSEFEKSENSNKFSNSSKSSKFENSKNSKKPKNTKKVIHEPKPASLYVSLLPDLQGTNKKMSASDPRSAIYLSDTLKDIKNKINKYAFSGGQETLELHRSLGGNTDVDVSYQYLRYFLEDDTELEQLKTGYEKGEVSTGEMKKRCIEVIQGFIREYQERRAKITDEVVKKFTTYNKK